MKPITADAISLVNRVARAGYHQHLAQLGPRFYIAGLLQQISTDPTGGLAEELGDVEHAECTGPKPPRESATRDVQRRRRISAGKGLEIRQRQDGGLSQSSPRAGRGYCS